MFTTKNTRALLGLAVIVVFAACQGESVTETTVAPGHEPVVDELVVLLGERPDLEAALEGAIGNSALNDVEDVDSFLDYLDEVGNDNGRYDVGDLRKWLRDNPVPASN